MHKIPGHHRKHQIFIGQGLIMLPAMRTQGQNPTEKPQSSQKRMLTGTLTRKLAACSIGDWLSTYLIITKCIEYSESIAQHFLAPYHNHVCAFFFPPNKIKVNASQWRSAGTSENKTFAVAEIIVLEMILQLNRNYFLTTTKGTDICSSLLEIERHLKHDHKSQKKPAKEVESEQ